GVLRAVRRDDRRRDQRDPTEHHRRARARSAACGEAQLMTRTSEVAIVGAAISDCGRVDTLSAFDLHQQAAARALADAGLTPADVDGFASFGMGVLAPIEIAEFLGLRPTWIESTGVGGGTWEVMLEHAVSAIQTGQATTVL